jgi:hypothetical protein
MEEGEQTVIHIVIIVVMITGAIVVVVIVTIPLFVLPLLPPILLL